MLDLLVAASCIAIFHRRYQPALNPAPAKSSSRLLCSCRILHLHLAASQLGLPNRDLKTTVCALMSDHGCLLIVERSPRGFAMMQFFQNLLRESVFCPCACRMVCYRVCCNLTANRSQTPLAVTSPLHKANDNGHTSTVDSTVHLPRMAALETYTQNQKGKHFASANRHTGRC